MKKQILISMLLASFLLASCQKASDEENTNLENNDKIIGNTSQETLPETERMSYTEYVEKYGTLFNNETNLPNETEIAYEDTTSNLLATYSTSLESSSDARINNIEIVCERLNNYILKPGETFSYNNVTGPFGEDDGFEKAPILLQNGEKTKGYGGGVCQLSSTLYNVVKNINQVEITERHHHSSPVSYVPEGEDATVSLQSNLDFQFVNHNQYPIRFKAKCENNEVTVWAYKNA